jgi:histidinol-phosphate aminotransferase
MSYERDNIRRMHGYTYGEQPDGADVIKLNTNENPYPPSPAVGAALKNFDATVLRRYPQPTADRFRAMAAARHGVSIDRVIVTNGGDELLRLLLATFLDTDECVGVAAPSYSLYDVLVAAHGCKMQNFAPISALPPHLPISDSLWRTQESGDIDTRHSSRRIR